MAGTGPGVTRVTVGGPPRVLLRHTKLTELVTHEYALDEINEGYQDLMEGKNIRGVVVHQH